MMAASALMEKVERSIPMGVSVSTGSRDAFIPMEVSVMMANLDVFIQMGVFE